MTEPLDLDAMEAYYYYRCRANPWEYADQLELIAELRDTRAERDVAHSDLDHERSYLRSALDRAERAEAALARVEAVLADPPVPSRMLIPVIRAALRGDG